MAEQQIDAQDAVRRRGPAEIVAVISRIDREVILEPIRVSKIGCVGEDVVAWSDGVIDVHRQQRTRLERFYAHPAALRTTLVKCLTSFRGGSLQLLLTHRSPLLSVKAFPGAVRLFCLLADLS